jgi:CheY-like chemotaxis protein
MPIKEEIAKHLVEAEKMIRSKRYDEAEIELNYVLQMDPKNYYGRSLQERLKPLLKKAEEKFLQQREAEAQSMDRRVEVISDLLKGADKFIAAREYKQALAQVAKVFSIDPKNYFAQAYSERIEMLMKEQPPAQASRPAPAPAPKMAPQASPAPQMPTMSQRKPSASKEADIAMYKELLREMWFDGKLSDAEQHELAKVRTLFAVSDEEHSAAEREVKVDAYIEALRIAWRDGVITQQEQAVLLAMRQKYNISMEEHMSAEARILWAKSSPEAKGALMIVEDDKALLGSLSARLKLHGYSVLTASSAETALELLQQNSPSLILSDVMLEGGMDGFAFYDRLRQDQKLKHTPFLLMSSISDEFVVRAGMRMGIDDFFTKPLNFELLLATIEGRLRQ